MLFTGVGDYVCEKPFEGCFFGSGDSGFAGSVEAIGIAARGLGKWGRCRILEWDGLVGSMNSRGRYLAASSLYEAGFSASYRSGWQ